MLFTITGKRFEITEAIRNYAEQKTSKLPRYYNSVNKIEVIIEGGINTVEIIASAEHNKVFIAEETGQDVYACIDRAVGKLERQLTRKKEKERDNRHRH